MKQLQADDEDAYKKQFSQYIKNGITAESVSVIKFLNLSSILI